ncbi:MAG: hypothetical protein PHG85_03020 [Candidatus Altiarchaeota archaeon]|nr:hypothetical protein [Candidatus Altiarchaeota archaeon]
MAKKTELRSVGVLSAGKIVGLLYGVFGIFGALFFIAYFGFLSLFGLAMTKSFSALLFGVFGIALMFFIPLFYGVLGFIFGCLAAFVYNHVAARIGGLEMEFSK